MQRQITIRYQFAIVINYYTFTAIFIVCMHRNVAIIFCLCLAKYFNGSVCRFHADATGIAFTTGINGPYIFAIAANLNITIRCIYRY